MAFTPIKKLDAAYYCIIKEYGQLFFSEQIDLTKFCPTMILFFLQKGKSPIIIALIIGEHPSFKRY